MQISRKGRFTGLLLAGVLAATGCYGNFNLTQRLWHWNGHVTDNRWANEGIFLVCAILPVYSICTFADAVVLNSVEFWTGKNWVDAPAGDHKMSSKIDATHDLTLEKVAANKVEVNILENGSVVGSYVLDTTAGDDTALTDMSGKVIARAHTRADGQVELLAAN